MVNLKNSKILVIIPAYQEEQSISGVIYRLQSSAPWADILVVNDGSKDQTSQRAQKAGVKVIDLPYNLGIGGAMQTGFKYAQKHNYDIAVQLDGDGQHSPDDLVTVIQPILEEKQDMVIGSRFLKDTGYRAPFIRMIGIKIFSSLVSLIIGKPITDTTSGYRAVNRKVIDIFAEDYPTDYPEVEVIIMLHRKQKKIKEVPVSMSHRTAGNSSITLLKSFYYMIKVFLSVLFTLTR